MTLYKITLINHLPVITCPNRGFGLHALGIPLFMEIKEEPPSVSSRGC